MERRGKMKIFDFPSPSSTPSAVLLLFFMATAHNIFFYYLNVTRSD